MKAMKTFTRLLALVLYLTTSACSEEEVPLVGSLEVFWTQQSVGGTPLNQYKVGLFDMSSLANYRFMETEALETKTLAAKVEFTNLNPGNYVVALYALPEYRKVVQVRAGQTATVILM